MIDTMVFAYALLHVEDRYEQAIAALDALQDAEALVDIIISSSQIRDVALKLAVEASHSFYDTLFVAAAIQSDTL